MNVLVKDHKFMTSTRKRGGEGLEFCHVFADYGLTIDLLFIFPDGGG